MPKNDVVTATLSYLCWEMQQNKKKHCSPRNSKTQLKSG